MFLFILFNFFRISQKKEGLFVHCVTNKPLLSFFVRVSLIKDVVSDHASLDDSVILSEMQIAVCNVAV